MSVSVERSTAISVAISAARIADRGNEKKPVNVTSRKDKIYGVANLSQVQGQKDFTLRVLWK
jgi:hypothetical protein